jgi:hypothetical protein
VTLHFLLVIIFFWLSLVSTSQDLFYLSAYIPPLLLLPFITLAVAIASLVFSVACKTGKNFHLLGSAVISLFLFLISLMVWKRDFEHGYIGSIAARILLSVSVFCSFTVALAWLVRRKHKTISLKQLSGSFLCVTIFFAIVHQILRFDKMSSYKLEIDAARELKRAGFQLRWKDWSVSSVALRNSGIRDAQLKRIGEFKNLRSLSLEGNPVTDETLALISNVHKLHGIYLSETSIGDGGLTYLANAVNLEQLWLSGTAITDLGLSNLENLKSLRYVDLSKTVVSDAGLEKLTHLKNMHYLHLPETKVTKSGMASLGRALPNCRIYGTPNGEPFSVGR